jgi:4-diphosphocytidyl-2-C-methyl-D-erythritol kinase
MTRRLAQEPSLTLHAPAKVNLYLRVVRRRPDGYHDLETLMVAIDLYDTLSFAPATGPVPGADEPHPLRLSISTELPAAGNFETSAASSGPLALGDDNLVLRAARLLREETGTTAGARIHLTKRIPWSAGLAGGSSDAATTLLGLNQLWELGLSLDQLRTLSERLGSDIPFFLSGGTAAICRGRGELIEPVSLGQRLPLVLLKPAVGLSTPRVFQGCTPADPGFGATDLVAELCEGRFDRAARQLYNGLQPAAEALCPDVGDCRRLCESADVFGHLMSGSGTSYFALCASRKHAQTLAARWRQASGCAVWAVSTCV